MSDSKRDDNHGDDASLFRKAVADIQPLKKRQRQLPKTLQPAKKRITQADKKRTLQQSLPADATNAPAAVGEQLAFQRNNVSRQTMRQLRRGRMPVQAEIDLHGMTLVEAHRALTDFIAECLQERCACARVVHGKGRGSGPDGPVLKPNVDRWLRQWSNVLAFCSATANDGGTGAVYVLLDLQQR